MNSRLKFKNSSPRVLDILPHSGDLAWGINKRNCGACNKTFGKSNFLYHNVEALIKGLGLTKKPTLFQAITPLTIHFAIVHPLSLVMCHLLLLFIICLLHIVPLPEYMILHEQRGP